MVVGFPDDSPTNVTFRGTYAPITFTTENRSILFLGDNNALYFPQPSDNKTPTIGAQRAYFQLAGLTAADVAQSRIVLRFVEDHSETTGIENDQCSMVRSAPGTLSPSAATERIFNQITGTTSRAAASLCPPVPQRPLCSRRVCISRTIVK